MLTCSSLRHCLTTSEYSYTYKIVSLLLDDAQQTLASTLTNLLFLFARKVAVQASFSNLEGVLVHI
jgi:hypothetical protein